MLSAVVTEVPDISTLAVGPLEIVLRLLCAMFVGAVIGTERELTHRPAGMRTHMLVALGSCVVMITSQMIFHQYRAFGATPDPARLSAQVITGVGFLGAGTILKEGPSIKGLTTAASVWAVACLGIAVGGGYYALGILGTVGMIVILVLFEWLQEKLMRERYALYLFSVSCSDVVSMLERINQLATECDASLKAIQVDGKEDGEVEITFKADFGGRHSEQRMQRFFAELSSDQYADSVKSERSRV
ncbi:MAG: MgtC/SapB family protein [Firmicutes bacterium]|nr:MgtC/SapB family protein [Bacillota bacterium]